MELMDLIPTLFQKYTVETSLLHRPEQDSSAHPKAAQNQSAEQAFQKKGGGGMLLACFVSATLRKEKACIFFPK